MARVLILTQILPYPLDAGPKIRAYYVIRYLSRLHEVSLLTFTRVTDTPDALDHLQQYCQQIVTVPIDRSRYQDALAFGRSLIRQEPFLIARDQNSAMVKELEKLIPTGNFEIIHADQLWMAPYALKAREIARATGYSPKLILDQHNAVHLIPQRMAHDNPNPIYRAGLLREARLMARYEVETCIQFDQVTWVTMEDCLAVQHQSPIHAKTITNQAAIIPICIDPHIAVDSEYHSAAGSILFLAGMHWPPNADAAEWFTKDVFPLIQAEIPSAHFFAVGKSPPLSIQNIPGVTAPGYVDDGNLLDYFEKRPIFVVPIHAGGGMRVKILDAWAHSLPIVSTTIGAEGIEYEHGNNILIADQPADFSAAIVKLLNNPCLANQIGRAGRENLLAHYDWNKVYPAWDQVIAKAMNDR